MKTFSKRNKSNEMKLKVNKAMIVRIRLFFMDLSKMRSFLFCRSQLYYGLQSYHKETTSTQLCQHREVM